MYNDHTNCAGNNILFASIAQNAFKDYWIKATENFFCTMNHFTNNIAKSWKCVSENNHMKHNCNTDNNCHSNSNFHSSCNEDEFMESQMQIFKTFATLTMNNIKNNLVLIEKISSCCDNNPYSKKKSCNEHSDKTCHEHHSDKKA